MVKVMMTTVVKSAVLFKNQQYESSHFNFQLPNLGSITHTGI